MALPPLTPEQRQAALDKAAASRRERAEVKNRLKNSGASIGDVHPARARPTRSSARCVSSTCCSRCPGSARCAPRQMMERLGIAESRRVRGLGAKQVAALEREFDAAWLSDRTAPGGDPEPPG